MLCQGGVSIFNNHIVPFYSMPSTRVLNGDPAIVDLGVAQGQTVGESHEALMRSVRPFIF
jgi:hypothetical protein